jgi:acetyltransferase-like isoleucine patch superfamily enzyme
MKTLILNLMRFGGRLWCQLQGVKIGARVLIHGFPRVFRKEGGEVIFCEGVTINASFWSNPLNDGRRTVLHVGRGARLVLGRNSGLSNARVICSERIMIGEESLVGAGCLICDSDMHEIPLGSSSAVKTAPITIGKRVFLGAGCIVLKGVTIGDGVVVGAGSVVAVNLPPGCLAAGNPCRVIRAQA